MFGMFLQIAAASGSTQAQPPAHEVLVPAVVKNPVPGFVGQVFQWLFNLPQWVQWSAIVIGVLTGVALALLIVIKRKQLVAWVTTRSHGYKIALVALSGVMLLGVGAGGYAGNHYMQHNNDFCVGCHVMGTAWDAFQQSEHRKLQCHDCHQQSMFASARQLYFWVAERPQEIPKHAKVPTAICSECHVQSPSDSSWKRIVATAGHRLHLKSDSSALKNVECVTCHGQEVHRFQPVDKTCGQSGCHKAAETKIVLGAMAGQTSQHCTGCHTFTKPVPENISMDSTKKYLMATGSTESCFGCHDMKSKLKGFDPQRDIGHKGVCGTCHNPHKQTTPKQAFETCASGGCHADLASKSAFHSKPSVHKIAKCGACHEAHEWKPKGTECIDCHKNVLDIKPKRVPAAPPGKNGAGELPGGQLELQAVVRILDHSPPRRVRSLPHHRRRFARNTPKERPALMPAFRHEGTRAAVPPRLQLAARQIPPARAPAQPVAAPKDGADFSHRIHKVVACANCHDQKVSPGAFKMRTTNDCAACHHSAERSVTCEGCHNSPAEQRKVYLRPVPMRTASGLPAKTRQLPFAHRAHRDLECKTCHTNGVMLGVSRDCMSCHTEHHTVERTCTACHADAKLSHQRAAHDGCAGSGCHSNATVVALPATRQVCLACHHEQVNHKPKRECAECHVVKWGALAGAAR